MNLFKSFAKKVFNLKKIENDPNILKAKDNTNILIKSIDSFSQNFSLFCSAFSVTCSIQKSSIEKFSQKFRQSLSHLISDIDNEHKKDIELKRSGSFQKKSINKTKESSKNVSRKASIKLYKNSKIKPVSKKKKQKTKHMNINKISKSIKNKHLPREIFIKGENQKLLIHNEYAISPKKEISLKMNFTRSDSFSQKTLPILANIKSKDNNSLLSSYNNVNKMKSTKKLKDSSSLKYFQKGNGSPNTVQSLIYEFKNNFNSSRPKSKEKSLYSKKFLKKNI